MDVLKRVILSLVLLPLIANQSLWACEYLKIYNETKQKIDEQSICDAAKPLYDKYGIETIVYVDENKKIKSKEDWFEVLDQKEQGFVTASGRVARNTMGNYYDLVLILEVNTKQEYAAIAFGADVLAYITDLQITNVSSKFENSLRNDDATLTELFVAVLKQLDGKMGMPINTNSGGVSVNSSSDSTGVVYVIGGILLFILLIIIVVIAKNSIRKSKALKKAAEERQKHVQEVWYAVGNLITACDALLGGRTKEDSELYKLWVLYYGDRQPNLHPKVSELITVAQQVYHRSFEAFERLSQQYGGGFENISDADLELLETLYISLRGTKPLTAQQISALLDPVQLPDEIVPVESNSKLLAQVNQVLHGLGKDNIYDTPVNEKLLKSLDAEGVLGYINEVKGQIGKLATAVATIQRLQEQLARQEAQFIAAFVALEPINATVMGDYLAKAKLQIENLIESYHYFIVEDWLNKLIQLTANGYWNETINSTLENLKQIEAIKQLGISYGAAEQTVQNMGSARAYVVKAIQDGLNAGIIIDNLVHMDKASAQVLEMMNERKRIKAEFVPEWNTVQQRVGEFSSIIAKVYSVLQDKVSAYGRAEQQMVLKPLSELPQSEAGEYKLSKAKLLFDAPEQPYEEAWSILQDVNTTYDVYGVESKALALFAELVNMEGKCHSDLAGAESQLSEVKYRYGSYLSNFGLGSIERAMDQVKELLQRKQVIEAQRALDDIMRDIDREERNGRYEMEAEQRRRKEEEERRREEQRRREQEEEDRRRAAAIRTAGSVIGSITSSRSSSSSSSRSSRGGGYSGGGRSSGGGSSGGGRSNGGGYRGGGRR